MVNICLTVRLTNQAGTNCRS